MILNEKLVGNKIILRTVCDSDCNTAYLKWMNDYETNYYMETRWNKQSEETILAFVNHTAESKDSYLFAIVEKESGIHIGDIKLGTIIYRDKYADII